MIASSIRVLASDSIMEYGLLKHSKSLTAANHILRTGRIVSGINHVRDEGL